MNLLRKLLLVFYLAISLFVMVPAWYSFLDSNQKKCTIEDFNSNALGLYNHVTITGNALFNYACKFQELHEGKLNNQFYYVPFVDSLWTKDKPVKTVLVFESGTMGFESGFKDAMTALDIEIDSLSKLSSNRITLQGNNKPFTIPKLEIEASKYFADSLGLNISKYTVSKIIIHEHFSMSGFIFMTIFTIGLGVLLYIFVLKGKKQKNS